MEATDLTRREDARIARSREALRGSLLALIEHRPLENITIREITNHAGVGYATFYRHYPDKAALLNDIAAGQIRALVALALPVLQASNALEACLAKFRYVEEHRSLWRALLTGGAASTIREEIIQISREVAVDYASQGHWLPDDLAFRFVSSAMIEVLTWWLERDDPISSEEGAALLHHLAISPVMDRPRQLLTAQAGA